ncbi:heterokaryon incompatibility protein-domain-containing protein [Whalleya microplaca]|nr:heterokaryon incompatibility protein-domain-containing protein [Whalleya microplaca]
MQYTYDDIGTRDSFRILRLHGSSDHESAIHCDLVKRSLYDQEPAYEALSYCWGGQTLSQTVFCNGQRLGVTKNCESAMRRFRPVADNSKRFIWIDAICIDQSNPEERGHQVQIMGDIYKGAFRTLVWLENESPPIEQARIRSREFHVKNISWLVRLAEATLPSDFHQKETQLLRVAEELNEGENDVTAASINETLVCLPWFKRLWIVQEVVLSKEATMVYGKQEVSVPAIIEVREILSSMKERGYHSVGAAMGILWNLFGIQIFGKRLLKSSQAGRAQLDKALTSFIGEVKYSKATDPRDKAFGLYGLLRDSGIAVPTPDYNKPVATVYRETLVAMMAATKSLDLIRQVDGLGSLPSRSSWVPDWSSSRHSIGPTAGPCYAVENSQPLFRLLEGSSMLALKGFKVDEIISRSSLSYMHIDERLGKPEEYTHWNRNSPILDQVVMQKLKQQPEYSAAILFLWNVKVLRDFVTFALGTNLSAASKESILALYCALLSQRGDYNSTPELGLEDLDVGERRARDFFAVLLDNIVEDEQTETDDGWIFDQSFSLSDSKGRVLLDIQHSQEYAILRRISQNPVRRSIFDCISRIRYMTVFKTKLGRIGIATWPIKPGDEIALCSGLGLPVVMRRNGSNFKLISCAYVDSIMHGEAWSHHQGQELRELIFV